METTTSVAQFISMATENEIREPGSLEFADVQEVGAELENAKIGFWSQFVVKTADGQEWTVRVTPKA